MNNFLMYVYAVAAVLSFALFAVFPAVLFVSLGVVFLYLASDMATKV
jgi:hypothetical protein